ncbi:hypothetical protein M0R45_036400 [Rubus argutus]|uniref:RING-type E3 ubiquitin transferase n=1 Tax=Rubus argutus TaxID=59490 RepID=A0AAW1VW14_RUBAR
MDVATGSKLAVLMKTIRFPFRLKEKQPHHCGFPGFDLYCNERNKTLLKLPISVEFIKNINYISQLSTSRNQSLALVRLATKYFYVLLHMISLGWNSPDWDVINVKGKESKKLAVVRLWSIQWYPVDQPSMKAVVQMLEWRRQFKHATKSFCVVQLQNVHTKDY